MASQSHTAPNGEFDFLDDIVMAEERLKADAYRAGVDAGGHMGYQDGYAYGRMMGRKIGMEVGGYRGAVMVWQKMIAEQPGPRNIRRVKAVETLAMMLEKFPLYEPRYEHYWDDLEKIRAKYKQVSMLFHVNPGHHQGDMGRGDLSF